MYTLACNPSATTDIESMQASEQSQRQLAHASLPLFGRPTGYANTVCGQDHRFAVADMIWGVLRRRGVPPAGQGANKCDKCNFGYNDGGCKCDDNCDCKKCGKCDTALIDGGCKCSPGTCDCIQGRCISCCSTAQFTTLPSGTVTGQLGHLKQTSLL
jgi:hypothetical protein